MRGGAATGEKRTPPPSVAPRACSRGNLGSIKYNLCNFNAFVRFMGKDGTCEKPPPYFWFLPTLFLCGPILFPFVCLGNPSILDNAKWSVLKKTLDLDLTSPERTFSLMLGLFGIVFPRTRFTWGLAVTSNLEIASGFGFPGGGVWSTILPPSARKASGPDFCQQ